jgi:glycosyltransferase
MRYLFTALPETSHTLPLVPLAHAAQARGHDVLFATSGPSLSTAAAAGLHAVAVDDGEALHEYNKLDDLVVKGTLGMDVDPEAIETLASIFAEMGAIMADGLVEVGKTWGADAVVHSAGHVAGLLTARVLGGSSVLHGVGRPHAPFWEALEHMAPVAQRMGVGEVPEADVQIDVSPPSLEPIIQSSTEAAVPDPADPVHQDTEPRRPSISTLWASHTPRLPMRFCSYSGGANLPRWVLERGSRPRVVATLGTVPQGVYGEGGLMREVILGTADLGIELVVTTAGAELAALPSPLPEHVRLVDWVPLRALLGTCEGIIHHGGQGTMYTAFAAGVPQLVIPAFADTLVNARIAVASGVGSMLEMPEANPGNVGAAVDELLGNPAYLLASRELAWEIRDMPEPSTVIDQITDLIRSRAEQRAS